MLRDILLELEPKIRKELYHNKYICGCLYRSFSDIEAHIFFRFTSNDAKITKAELYDLVEKKVVKEKLTLFSRLNILINSPEQPELILNRTFAKNVQQFLLFPKFMEPIPIEQPPPKKEPEPYQFLELLFNGQLPKNCNIEGMSENSLTRKQFNYIKSDISWKIGLLINGIISNSRKIENISNVVKLNLLDSRYFYKKTEQLDPLLVELQKINLVQFAGPLNSCFRISQYLEHFTFAKAKKKEVKTKLNCQIVIETNFKVFVILQRENRRENQIIRKVLSRLLFMDSNDAEYEELIIGEIKKGFMRDFFNRTDIPPEDYFEFFKQYIEEEEQNKEKDSSKFSKFKFLGYSGPAENGIIPSNIRQEVNLWNQFREDSDDEK